MGPEQETRPPLQTLSDMKATSSWRRGERTVCLPYDLKSLWWILLHSLPFIFFCAAFVQALPPRTSQLPERCSEISWSWSCGVSITSPCLQPNISIAEEDLRAQTWIRAAGENRKISCSEWSMQPGERLQRTEMNRGVQEQTGVFTLSVDCVFVSFVYSVQRIMTHRNLLAEVEVRDFWENRPQH